MAMNVGGAITPTMNHTERVLFRPFALRKWLGLGLVSMLAELGGGGGGGGGGGNFPSSDSPSAAEMSRMMVGWIVEHVVLIVIGCVLLFAVGLALMWLGSVFRFVYLNQITRDPYAIREPFGRFTGLGTSYFLWQLAFGLAMLIILAVLIGAPLLAAFARFHGDFGPAQTLAIIWAVLAGIAILIASAVVDVFARDFVVTAMFVRGVKVIEGWRIVMPIIGANAGQSALYVLMLIVIGIVTGIGSLIVLIAVGIVFAIVGVLFALIGYGIYTAGGWSPVLIGYSIVMGLALLLAFSYAMSCAMQPFMVFRRTFALVVLGQADPSLATVPGTAMQGWTGIG